MAEQRTARSETPPPVGFTFPATDVDISKERQALKLACCGLDAAIWGDFADPSFFAFYTIMAQRWTGRSINGNVHMSQIYNLTAGLPLGAPLTMTGEVTSIHPHPRGARVFAEFEFKTANGAMPLAAKRSSLNPGEGDPNAPRNTHGPLQLDRMTQVHEVTLEPDMVAGFSDEAENLIHSDPATAESFGFRAPIAGGLMASHIMLGGLIMESGTGPITGLDAEIAFLRPMFWDERLRMMATPKDAAGPREMTLLGDDGKPRCWATVSRIAFG
jgi:hypothetical protein